jgi:hypothetical protein
MNGKQITSTQKTKVDRANSVALNGNTPYSYLGKWTLRITKTWVIAKPTAASGVLPLPTSRLQACETYTCKRPSHARRHFCAFVCLHLNRHPSSL